MSLPMPTTSATTGGDSNFLRISDGPLVELTQACGGDLRKLLYCFFSFLHRRTDFYCVPHPQDIKEGLPHTIGFKQGDAEKILLAAFRQFPLRQRPRLEKKKTTTRGHDPPGVKTEEEKPQIETIEPLPNNNNENDAAVPKRNNDLEREKESASASLPPPTPTPPKASMNFIEKSMKEIQFTDEGLQVPVGNGGTEATHQWTQTLEEVTVSLPLPNGTRGRDLNVVIKVSFISVSLAKKKDGILLEGNLTHKIVPGESTWSLEGGVLSLILQKPRGTWWKCIFEGDCPIDTDLIDSRRRIGDYDESTQGVIERILADRKKEGSTNKSSKSSPSSPSAMMADGIEYIDGKRLKQQQKGEQWEV